MPKVVGEYVMVFYSAQGDRLAIGFENGGPKIDIQMLKDSTKKDRAEIFNVEFPQNGR